jgi:hypothetical protein
MSLLLARAIMHALPKPASEADFGAAMKTP